MSLFDEILKRLKAASPREQNEFMKQVRADKELFEALKRTGIEHYDNEIGVTDGAEKAVERPRGVLSLTSKSDLVAEVTRIGLLEELRMPNFILNGRFKDGWANWSVTDGLGSLVTLAYRSDLKETFAKIVNDPSYLTYFEQFAVAPVVARHVTIRSKWLTENLLTDAKVTLYYSDGTTEEFTKTLVVALVYYNFVIQPTTDKVIVDIMFSTTVSNAIVNVGCIEMIQRGQNIYDVTPYKSARIDCSTNGDNVIVPAVAGKTIKVHGYEIQAKGTVTAVFASDVAGGATDISPEWKLQDREGVAPAMNPYPAYKFKTAGGKALNLKLDANVVVTGNVLYTDSDA